MEAAGPGVARALEIDEGDKVVHWQRIRFADGTPMCLEDAYMADSIVPEFLSTRPCPRASTRSSSGATCCPPGARTRSTRTCEAGRAKLLGIDPGAPVLRIARRAFDGNIAVEVSRSTYRADRYTLWVPVCRPNTPVKGGR